MAATANESRQAEQGEVPTPMASPTAIIQPASTQRAETTADTELKPQAQENVQSEGKANPPSSNAEATTASRFTKSASDPVPGWATIAYKQASWANTSLIRKFDVEVHRLLIDEQVKLRSIFKLLRAYDEDDDRLHPDRLKALIFNPETLLEESQTYSVSLAQNTAAQLRARQPHDQDKAFKGDVGSPQNVEAMPSHKFDLGPKERLLDVLFPRITRYYTLIDLFSKIDKLPQISKHTYENYIKLIRKDIPDGEAWQALTEEGKDFITIRARRIHEKFEWIMYSNNMIDFVKKIFFWLFKHRDSTLVDPDKDYVNPNLLEIFVMVMVGLFCIGMLVTPASLLLLANLSKEQSLVVVVSFSVSTIVPLSLLQLGFFNTLLGFSGYFAVLATFLSNLNQGKIN